MANVDARAVAFALAEETSLKAAGSTWYTLEPNDVPDFSAEIGTVARNPISGDRVPRAGTATTIDVAAAMEHDITHHIMGIIAEQFFWAEAVNDDMFFEGLDVGTLDEFEDAFSPSPSANQDPKFQFNASGPTTIMYAQGYANAINNGQHLLASDPAGTDITVATTPLVEETAPANATLEVAGIRTSAADLEITAKSAGVVTMISGSGAGTTLDMTTLGWVPGQIIHVGGTAAANQFDNGAGYGRLLTIAANSVTLEDLSGTLAVDANATKQVDLLWGRHWRPVLGTADADDNRYKKTTVTIEGTYPDIDGGTTNYRYLTGLFGNTLTFNVPLEDKATLSLGWPGLNLEPFTASQKAGAATPIAPLRTTAVNTTSNVAVMRIGGLSLASDPCFQDFSLTIDNGVVIEKCIGTFGGDNGSPDIFSVSIDSEYLLAFKEISDAIRNSTVADFSMVLENTNGAIALDIPGLLLGSGTHTFPTAGTVRETITGLAQKNDTTGTHIGLSMFPVVP